MTMWYCKHRYYYTTQLTYWRWIFVRCARKAEGNNFLENSAREKEKMDDEVIEKKKKKKKSREKRKEKKKSLRKKLAGSEERLCGWCFLSQWVFPPAHLKTLLLLLLLIFMYIFRFLFGGCAPFSFPWCYFNFVTACPRPALLPEKK